MYTRCRFIPKPSSMHDVKKLRRLLVETNKLTVTLPNHKNHCILSSDFFYKFYHIGYLALAILYSLRLDLNIASSKYFF